MDPRSLCQTQIILMQGVNILKIILTIGIVRCVAGSPGLFAADWPMWGGSPMRNNAPVDVHVPAMWDVGNTNWHRSRIRKDDRWVENPDYIAGRGPVIPPGSKNIQWAVRLGSQTYGNPSLSGGKVFIGTNNQAGYLERFPESVDLGVLLCFEEQSGQFLWQYSSPKLPTGRVHDWPLQGMPSTPLIEGDRLWAVTNRCEVICLDTEGFHDFENDGPFRTEEVERIDEADVVWMFDMMSELGVSPHNMSNCSMCAADGRLFICTSNGMDESHVNLPAPNAPAFLAMSAETGKVLWTDNSPETNILHGQWASPSYGVFDGVPQVIFAGGDGWLYSFAPEGNGHGGPKLLWKFDCNPKASVWALGGQGTRNNIIAFPMIYNDLVYVAVGQDPEHGEGLGHVWCIDPSKMTDGSDVSSELVIDARGQVVPHRRIQAVSSKSNVLFSALGPLWEGLSDGILSEGLREEFAKAGVKLPSADAITIEFSGSHWTITAMARGVQSVYSLSNRGGGGGENQRQV